MIRPIPVVLVIALAAAGCSQAEAPAPSVLPAATLAPGALPTVVKPTDAAATSEAAFADLDEVGGFKIMTCEAMAEGGGGQDALTFTVPIYTASAIRLLNGEPVVPGADAPDLNATEKRAIVTSLENLLDDDGKFCGVADDPGGWR